jgi:putative GTP pyrophosphokinase
MHKLIEKYRSNLESFDAFRIKIEVLIKELLIQNDINFHKIESRIKDPINLEDKIQRKNDKYSDLKDITDLVGLRIITFFEDEIDKVAEILKSEFIIDTDNSIDKRKLESDRFGYLSLHYVLELTDERKKLTEYNRFKNIKVEVQVRSVLQHAWAEIEHDIGYKGEITIPDKLKRNFYRVAALLETADLEFIRIREEQKNYEKSVGDSIKNNPEDVEINATSLRSYIKSSKIIKEIEDLMSNKVGWIYSDELFEAKVLITKLNFLKVRTIKQLDNLLIENKTDIVQFCTHWAKSRKKGRKVNLGIAIFYLAYVLVAKTGDEEYANIYFNSFIQKNKNGGKIILDTFKEMKSST